MNEHRPDMPDPKEIIVVDDSLDSLRYLTDTLQKQGYRVRPATSGELALSAVAAKRPDLILLDVKMPGMDGYEVCRRLKSDPENARVPIIFISALDEPEDKVKAFAAGGVDYITKPLNSEEVQARVQTHLQLQELAGRLEQLVVERTADLTEANRKLHAALEARKRDNALINLRLKLMQYAADHSLEDLMRTSLDEVEKLTDSKISFYHIVHADQKTLTLTAWSTNTVNKFYKAEGDGMHFGIDEAGVWGDCVRKRQAVIYNDYESLPHKKGMPDGHADVARQLVVPIFRHDTIVSILGVGNKVADYTQEDVQTATYCADVIWEITETYKQERKIRESEKLLKHITGNVPGVVYQFCSTLEHEFSLRFVSEKVAEIFGLAPSTDNFFENFTECIPEPDREAFIASIQAAVDYVTPWYYEGRFIQPSGREMWFSGNSVPHKEGNNVVFDGVLLDITERIETTASLRLNEMRLEALIELNQMTEADIRQLTDFALEEAIKLTSSEIGYLAFTAEDETILEIHSWSKEAMRQCVIEDKQIVYEVEHTGLWGEAIRQRRPIITNDYQAPSKYKKGHPEGHVPIFRHMNIPVFDEDRIVAVAGVGNKKAPYVESDVNQLTLLMQGMWRLLQRKQAEEALRQSEDRFRRLFQQAPIPLMIVDSNDQVQYLNDRFTEYYGYDQNDIPSLDAFWPEAIPDAEHRGRMLAFWSESHQQARTTGKTIEPLVSDVTCKNGRVRTAEVSAISLGQLLLTSWVDLTEQKRVQDEINQRKQFLELVLNHLPDAIVTLDPEHLILDWNPGAVKMFGYTPEEAIGRNLDELVARDAAFEEAGQKTAQVLSGKPVEPFETVRHHKDGTPLHVIAAGSPIMSDDILTGVVAVYTNISEQRKMEDERKEYEARIQQMQKMEAIGTLAGGIAHDFNNILSGVIGYAELSLAEIPQSTALQRNLRQILAGGRRAGDLVRQILTFSRQNERELKPLQIGPMLKEALKLLRSSLPVTIEISKYISPDVDNIMADPTQIHQIIMNLCTNAAQAMDTAGGRLRVELAQESLEERDVATKPGIEPGPFARISVEDNGKGILPENVGRIFNPYFTTKRTGEGTGLGLAMVHGIVQSYRGFINVDSTPGSGTRFDVFIPSIETEQLLEVQEEMDLPTGNERILVVDDEEVLVDVIQGILTFMGYQVTTSNSSNEALIKFAAAPSDFDLVLTDMTMPDLTGIQLSNRLREIRPDIPIVLCTGYSHQLTNRSPEELGLKAIVMKPIQTGDLAITIRKVLDKETSGAT